MGLISYLNKKRKGDFGAGINTMLLLFLGFLVLVLIGVLIFKWKGSGIEATDSFSQTANNMIESMKGRL